ncbi:signal peptidase I [Brachybacterium timonense]|uniref:signal peptidase I n=1 Tax=Brachybacterium timonense TaxID=2050896 RepID=UPI000D0ACBE3|nr:signal peptidase I [Brachybacterium timonense]
MTSRSDSARRRSTRWVIAAVCVLALLLGAVAVRQFVVRPFTVPSESMAPLLRSGDVILADRSTRGTARRGDVVVFDGSGYFGSAEDGSRYWVKRVIAVGGDSIRCCDDDGNLILNDEPLAEPYLAPGTEPSRIRFDLRVPEGSLFLLGDNRADSTDSRFLLGAPGGGMVPEGRVVGQLAGVIWPLPRAGSR